MRKGTIAMITARGGSKRIPRKNIRDFCGKPILAYSIEAALSSGIFDEVMVSTEDTEIAGIARQYGAAVPFLRSAETADDYATTADVLLEVFAQYKAAGREFQSACCIYPTAPFVTAEKLKHAMECLEEEGTDSVIPVTAFSFPPMRGFLLENGEARYAFPEYAPIRSQDIPPMYHDCGQFYCFRVAPFLENRQLVSVHTRAVIVPEMEVQEIDSEQDWRLAELKYRFMREKTVDAQKESDFKGGADLRRVEDSKSKVNLKNEEDTKDGSESRGRADSKIATRHCFLRKAEREDMGQLFLWANDKEVRKNSFSMAPISYEEHRNWYGNKLQEENTRIYIFCDGDLEVGALRLEFGREGAEISYSIAPEFRGKGYGQELIFQAEQEVRRWQESIPALPERTVIKAQVKPENQGSNKIFTKAGYEIYSIGYQKIL